MADLRIVLLSGPFKVGKSALTTELSKALGFRKISSSDYLRTLIPNLGSLDPAQIRSLLQEKGDELDRQTDYRWIVDPAATTVIEQFPQTRGWLIDAVRKHRQVEHFRDRFGSAVEHIHLIAPEAVLLARSGYSQQEYEAAIAHPNEVNSRNLGEIADRMFDTTEHTPQEIATLVARKEHE